MMFLADFSPIKPDFGLLFWTTVIFLIFWWLMSKYAFGPIRDALKKRESDIQNSLDEAKRAKDDIAQLQSKNEALLAEAREERSKIMKEAKEAKETIIRDAKAKAKEDAQKIVNNAQQEIENQKNAAMLEVKNKAGAMALAIAEKVIRKELAGDNEQEKFANSLVDEIKFN